MSTFVRMFVQKLLIRNSPLKLTINYCCQVVRREKHKIARHHSAVRQTNMALHGQFKNSPTVTFLSNYKSVEFKLRR